MCPTFSSAIYEITQSWKDTFKVSQAYAIIVLPNGGPDLEAYTFQNSSRSGWRKACSLFWQVAKSLAHAEHLVAFEVSHDFWILARVYISFISEASWPSLGPNSGEESTITDESFKALECEPEAGIRAAAPVYGWPVAWHPCHNNWSRLVQDGCRWWRTCSLDTFWWRSLHGRGYENQLYLKLVIELKSRWLSVWRVSDDERIFRK